MPTRPSSGTPSRSKKAPTRTLPPGESSNDDVEITRAKLERREIPSFSESREARIAERAYWRAERRGFEPGHELDDWLSAERDVDSDPSK